MVNDEPLVRTHFRLLNWLRELGLLVRLVHALAERRIRASRGLARRVEQPQDAARVLLDQIDAALVILVLNRLPLDALLGVNLLLSMQDA